MHYNLDELREITDGDNSLLTSMIRQFIVDAYTSVGNINNAIKIKDFSSLKFNAHRIRPAVNNLKIEALRDIIKKIEVKAEQNLFDSELLTAVEKLDNLIEETISQLKIEFGI